MTWPAQQPDSVNIGEPTLIWDQFGVTAMEESGEYRVTRSKGRGPGRKIHKVIFRHLDEAPARRFYERTPPAPGYILALWRPDGTLIASTNGLAQPAS